MKRKILYGSLSTALIFGLWFCGPFKWRAELEYGIKLPNSANDITGFYGTSRTLNMLGFADLYEMGSVLKFSVNKQDWKELMTEVSNKCNYPYQPEFDYSKRLDETNDLKFHMLFKDKKYGDYLFVAVNGLENSEEYSIKFSSNWN